MRPNKTSPILNIALDAIDQLSDEELDALAERIEFTLWDRAATDSLYDNLSAEEFVENLRKEDDRNVYSNRDEDKGNK